MAKQYGILVDMESCLGCGVCVVACKQENGLPPYVNDRPGTIGLACNQVLRFIEGSYPDLTANYLHIHCQQGDFENGISCYFREYIVRLLLAY